MLDSIPKEAEERAEPVRRLEAARWGLVPSWAKDVGVGGRAFNARIESVGDNAMFKNAVRKRRALVPATGYYEWHTVDGVKHPHFIHLPDELTVFAGLYEWWRNRAEGRRRSGPTSGCCPRRSSRGTRRVSSASIHDRMPVFLAPELIEEWLDPHAEISDELLEAVAGGGAEIAERMELYEVGREVGNVRNNGPELLGAGRAEPATDTCRASAPASRRADRGCVPPLAGAPRSQARPRTDDRAVHRLRRPRSGSECSAGSCWGVPTPRPTQRAEKVRGWRSFFSIPVVDDPITVTAGSVTHTRHRRPRRHDRPARRSADLEPGWQELTLAPTTPRR